MAIGHWAPIERGRLARSAGECIAPQLWRGCIGLWAPCLGRTGDKLREWTAGGDRCVGNLTNMDGNDWVPSPLGWALDFDGSNDYVALPSAAATRMSSTTGITIFGVLSITGSVTVREYITNASGGGAPTGFGFGPSDAVANQTKWYTGNGSFGDNLQGGSTLTSGVWYSVAATYRPTSSGEHNKFTYLDGKVDQSKFTTNIMAWGSNTAAIARWDAAASQYFPGKIAFMAVWNYAMQARQIMVLHTDPVQMFRKRRAMMTVQGAGLDTYTQWDLKPNPAPGTVWRIGAPNP